MGRNTLLWCITIPALLFVSRVESGVEINGTWHEKTETREKFCLNGEWQFHPLQGDWQMPPSIGEVDGYDWKMKMRVPGTWKSGLWPHEHQFLDAAEIEIVSGCLRAWYKRDFFVPAE